jgi:CTP:molybdopterin cytidylyltransferase MocA
MAGRSENAFEVLSREEAAPEVEHPATMVTNADVKAGLAKTTTEGVAHVAAGQVGGCAASAPAVGCWLLLLAAGPAPDS